MNNYHRGQSNPCPKDEIGVCSYMNLREEERLVKKMAGGAACGSGPRGCKSLVTPGGLSLQSRRIGSIHLYLSLSEKERRY